MVRVNSRVERRSWNRKQIQVDAINKALHTWNEEGGACQVVSELLQVDFRVANNVDREFKLNNTVQCKRKINDGHYAAAVKILASSGVALLNKTTKDALIDEHPRGPSLVLGGGEVEPLVASSDIVLRCLKSFPKGTSCGKDGLREQHLQDILGGDVSLDLLGLITKVVNLWVAGKCPRVLGEFVASAPLTPLLKPD